MQYLVGFLLIFVKSSLSNGSNLQQPNSTLIYEHYGDILTNCTPDGLCLSFKESKLHSHSPILRTFEVLYNIQEMYLSVFSAVGILGNSLICIVIAKFTKLHNSANCYVFGLAVTDIVSLVSRNIQRYIHISGWWLKFMRAVIVTSNAANVWTTVGLAQDRYIAVCLPFKSRTICTQSRALRINIFIWLSSFLYSSFAIFLNSDKLSDGTLKAALKLIFSTDMKVVYFFLLPVVIISSLYSCIVLSLCKSAQLRKDSYAMEQTTKGLNLSVSIILQFTISWGLFYAYLFLSNHCPTQMNGLGGLYLFYISEIGILLSKIIDPFVFCCVSRQFRNAFKEFVWSSSLFDSLFNSREGM